MAGFITAFPNSLKGELPQAIQNFVMGGDQFKVALGVAAPAGTYDADSANYSELVGAGDELLTGSGYVTGGFAFTSAQNLSPQVSNPDDEAYWSWSVNPQWVALTADTSGCLIYNDSKAGKLAYVGGFGGVVSAVAQTLTLVLPVNAPGTALLALV